MKFNKLTAVMTGLAIAASATASTTDSIPSNSSPTVQEKKASAWSRLQVGGYGEVAMTRNFYSDNYLRYTQPEKYRDASHGRFDIPHLSLYLGYDFGKGWSVVTEIEFEHGGIEAATEIETEEAGEYETETERGGEVALEKFYIQKEFFPALTLRARMQVVPVGYTHADR